MSFSKFFWFLKTFYYKLFFGKIGFPSYIGTPIFIGRPKNIFLGDRVRVYPGSRMETLSQGKITIDKNVSIGQNFHIISGCSILIEENVTISANVFISDVEHNYNEIGIHVMEQPLSFNEVIIGENSFIGYSAVIRSGTVLGRQCIVGANSVVKGCFPDYCVIAGNPAKIIKKYDTFSGLWSKYYG